MVSSFEDLDEPVPYRFLSRFCHLLLEKNTSIFEVIARSFLLFFFPLLCHFLDSSVHSSLLQDHLPAFSALPVCYLELGELDPRPMLSIQSCLHFFQMFHLTVQSYLLCFGSCDVIRLSQERLPSMVCFRRGRRVLWFFSYS